MDLLYISLYKAREADRAGNETRILRQRFGILHGCATRFFVIHQQRRLPQLLWKLPEEVYAGNQPFFPNEAYVAVSAVEA